MVKGSWLHLPEWAVKKKKQPLNVYLNRWALAAAEAVRTEDARIFSWRCTRAGCEHHRGRSPRRGDVPLASLAGDAHNDLVVAGHEIVAQCQLGHKGGVGQQFYAKFRRIAPRVMESDKILPQPHTTKVKLPLANPQGVLFEPWPPSEYSVRPATCGVSANRSPPWSRSCVAGRCCQWARTSRVIPCSPGGTSRPKGAQGVAAGQRLAEVGCRDGEDGLRGKWTTGKSKNCGPRLPGGRRN